MGPHTVFSGLIKLLRFSIQHSLRDMWRNRARTMFALVCVITGVAAVVALRSLAFMVGDELTTNLAQINRGDIRIYASRGVPELVELSGQASPVFTQETVDLVRRWAASEEAEVTFARLSQFAQVRRLVNGEATTSQAAQTLFIEPERYPFYDTIMLKEPAGVPLEAIFVGGAGTADDPLPVVISSNLTRRSNLGLQLGDRLRIGASEAVFEVRGIAPATAETVLSNPSAAFLGNYLYLPIGDLAVMGELSLPDQIFVKVKLGHDISRAEASLIKYLQNSFDTRTSFKKELNRASVPELEKQNAETANVIDDMILVMGLTSLLIGGIGIVNTMLVVVSRRMLEIAVLKTLGLKGYRVTLLFLVEALLMGLIGSLVGIVVGVILSYLIRGVGEEALSLSLEWRLYPEAMFSGLFLGIVMTALFGFLPTLIAGQVRPAVVLRPNEAQMPAAGLIQTLLTIIVMITILGLLVSSIVENALHYGPVYMIVGGGALVGLFAGVIVANTRLGQPVPSYYVFRLPRRYERLENWIIGASGMLVGWLPVGRWAAVARRERGRSAVTLGLRALRQLVLLYGASAVGAALASVIVLLVSELWLPFGIGSAKPANDVLGAWRRGDVGWVVIWGALTLLFGYLIRRYAQGVVGVIALGSLGVSLGGLFGLLGGFALERLLGGSGVWGTLEHMSTGIVLVEGGLAILAAVYMGYWLLVWVAGRMSATMLMGVVSLVVLGLVVGACAAVLLLGDAALVVLILVACAAWVGVQLRVHERVGLPGIRLGGRRAGSTASPLPAAVSGTPVLTLGVIAVAGSVLLINVGGLWRWVAVATGAAVFVGLWAYLRRSYAIDGRLILREMVGRRGRVTSTLLGLSVGIAGLSLVSLTTSAVSNMLEIQLGETAEGNLLIGDMTSEHGAAVLEVLRHAEGVESFSQVTTYRAVLMKINGEQVMPFHRAFVSEEEDPRENSNLERVEAGVPMGLTVRASLDDLPDYRMENGRPLEPGDEGQHRIMLRESFITEEFEIETGDRLLFLFENSPGEEDDVLIQVRVVGVISRKSEQTGLEELGNLSVLPPGVLSETIRPEGIATVAQIDESDDVYMDQVLVALSDVPGVVAFELSALTQLAQSLLDQMKAIPTLVAWLALVAGTAIIANTVALATQERRRQIGVMKAIGLKGKRVLLMLMIENGLIGLIAGLIGAGVGFVVTVVLVLVSENPEDLKRTIEFSTIGWLVLMSILVAIGAATLAAWSAAAEKPMNVLRYE
jgi:ABC-type antimicrobial peptide transport system permease subunit